jgi:CDP-diacylglycerol--glycerol-3-phosphate 3-phosphatidyltransferase
MAEIFLKAEKITVSDKILAATVLKLFPRRVTPNQLTIFRFFTVPFVLLLLFLGKYEWGTVLFTISAFTDALDGAMARTRNQITEWGKIYDPLADKLLIVLTALFLIPQHLGFPIIFALLSTEMLLIGAAYYLKNKGKKDIQANIWGKIKMILQSFGVGFLFLFAILSTPWLLAIAAILLYASILFAVISLVTYGI